MGSWQTFAVPVDGPAMCSVEMEGAQDLYLLGLTGLPSSQGNEQCCCRSLCVCVCVTALVQGTDGEGLAGLGGGIRVQEGEMVRTM